MKLDILREAVRRSPFQPFQLKLVNGTTIDFKRSGRLLVGNGFIVRTFAKDNDFELYQEYDIESLQYLPVHATSSN